MDLASGRGPSHRGEEPALVGGAGIFSYEAGQQTGKGASDALTIVGIGAAVALVLYAANLSHKK